MISSSPPDAAAVLAAIDRVRARVTAKILADQCDVPTFFDNYILSSLAGIEQQVLKAPAADSFAGAMELVRRFADVVAGERFVSWRERSAQTREWQRLPWELTRVQIYAGQGVAICLSWKGMPLFKSAFDFAIYPMLIGELRPRTVIELGSGTGASAIWLADLLRLYGTGGRVYSVDLVRPDVSDPDVTFVGGDVNRIEDLAREAGIGNAPHPWLVIEDVHENTFGSASYFARLMTGGDYLIVEDSFSKQGDLARFDEACGDAFRVDTRYTDFFGRNTASAFDSILAHI